jgi:hypothetical protein
MTSKNNLSSPARPADNGGAICYGQITILAFQNCTARQVKFRILVLMSGCFGLAACATPSPQMADMASQTLPVSAQGLVGSTPQMLNADFGAPVLRRMDGPAQVWLYHSAVCRLDVFLYPDASGTPRVSTAVLDNGDPASCMRSLAAHGLTTAGLEPPASS